MRAIHRRRFEEQPELYGEDVHRRVQSGKEVSGADYAEYRERARVWSRSLEPG